MVEKEVVKETKEEKVESAPATEAKPEEGRTRPRQSSRDGGFNRGNRGGGGFNRGRPFVRMSREEREEEDKRKSLESWVPKTALGKQVREGKIKNIDEIINNKILESEIIDSLIELKSDLLAIGQSKGKFGGGKRRAWKQTQRKTGEGNVPTFSCMSIVGDKNGHIGVGFGKAKETLPAREKALRKAKLGIIKITRGCGSFDCVCSEKHSIPFKVEGKCGSSRIVLYPAPQGTGLVIGNECKKILGMVGIEDIYSKTFGQTKSTMNLAKACLDALKKTNTRAGQ
jgi:small subunit ribosomal protein S5